MREVVTAEELKREEIVNLQSRTDQLFELIAFDPKNIQLYRDEIIVSNIRLVPHVLKKYKPFGDDEYQLGCLGLIIATRTFDPSRGVPFSSYACFCIARELHKAHKHSQSQFETQMGYGMVSLDECVTLDSGDTVNKHEQVPDIMAEEEFDALLNDYSLEDFFEKIILPSIDDISKDTKGQNAQVQFDVWKNLELQYILEMSEVDSQKARLSLSTMARKLNVSTQNIRMRHKRVLHTVRQRCKSMGYDVG